MIFKFYILLFFPLISPAINHSEKDFSFIFEVIDNRVEILVNDKVVYDSKTIIDPGAMKNTEIFLKEYLTEPNNKVVLKLYNGAPPYQDQTDEYWEIKYKLMEGNEEIEYYRERNEHARIGLVLEEVYYL